MLVCFHGFCRRPVPKGDVSSLLRCGKKVVTVTNFLACISRSPITVDEI